MKHFNSEKTTYRMLEKLCSR